MDRAPPHAPEPADPSAPPLDLARLREVIGDDEDFLVELLAAYVDSASGLVHALLDAIGADNAGARARAAHQLKGASLNVGATALAALAATLEDGAAPAAGAELERTWAATRAAIEALVNRPAGTA